MPKLDASSDKHFDYDYQVELQKLWAANLATLQSKVLCMSCGVVLVRLEPSLGLNSRPGRRRVEEEGAND